MLRLKSINSEWILHVEFILFYRSLIFFSLALGAKSSILSCSNLGFRIRVCAKGKWEGGLGSKLKMENVSPLKVYKHFSLSWIFFPIVPELRQWCFILFLGKLNDFNVWYLLIWIFSKPLDEFIVLDFSNIVIKTEFI